MTDTIKTPADQMHRESLNVLEMVLGLHDGSQRFQRMLIDAEQADAMDIAAVTRLISLAHAALIVADSGADDLFTSWYRDKAGRMLCRAVDAVAAVEADLSRRATSGLN